MATQARSLSKSVRAYVSVCISVHTYRFRCTNAESTTCEFGFISLRADHYRYVSGRIIKILRVGVLVCVLFVKMIFLDIYADSGGTC